MLGKLKNFTAKLRRRADDRSRVLRGYAQAFIGSLRFSALPPGLTSFVYSAYAPDSAAVFAQHPEAPALWAKWQQGNRRNNTGDKGRFFALLLNLKQLLKVDIAGDFAELGVYKGNSAAMLAYFAARSGRKAVLLDTFGGFDDRDLVDIDRRPDFQRGFSDTSLAGVRLVVGEPDHCVYVPGYFPDSINPDLAARSYAFVHIDCDLYKPMKSALEFFYPRLTPGGMMFLHDYSSGPWAGATSAIDEFCRNTGECLTLLPDKSGTAILRTRRR